MLASINSPTDLHDAHLKHLIDQRTIRADLKGRFSAISECSDTPSIYSRPFFSPQSVHSTSADSYDKGYASPVQWSNKNRMGDPAASMLDMDDDPRSSYGSSRVYDERSINEGDDEDNEPLPRMSILGPKMRFHSRAPWEDGTALEEEDEGEEGSHQSSGISLFSRNKDRATANISISSSPRASNASRPSGESSYSQINTKHSFETTSSQISYSRGALYALAQESLSTSSLGRKSGSNKQENTRPRFALARGRSRSPTVSIFSSPAISPTQLSSHNNAHQSTLQADSKQHFHKPVERRYSSSSDDGVHPYANPDLVVSYNNDPPPRSPLRSTFEAAGVSRSNSNSTVTEVQTIGSILRPDTLSTMVTEASVTSVPAKFRGPSVQNKGISSPVLVHNNLRSDTPVHSLNNCEDQGIPHKPSGAQNLPGWMDGKTPAFELISLEEARAQRLRSVTVHTHASHSSTSTASGSIMSFPNTEQQSIASVLDSVQSDTKTSRARARSISAGAKAKNALQTIVGPTKFDRRESEPASVLQHQFNGGQTKSLKHKKSGFMRLFNGGRGQEREDRTYPPPVPTLSDVHTAQNVNPRVLKSPNRVPAPSLPLPSFDSYTQESLSSNTSNTLSKQHGSGRSPRMLTINTVQQGNINRSTNDVKQGTDASAIFERPWPNDGSPSSAPAGVPDFPTLKLRPVSTLFSAHFGDHIVITPEEPALDPDLGTPRSSSPSGVTSPMTPGSFTRQSNERLHTQRDDDQSSVIRALQDEITTAKKAWQRHVRELESQVRDLKAAMEDMRPAEEGRGYCDTCGRGKATLRSESKLAGAEKNESIVNRPRARTGTASRFVNAQL